MTTANPSPRHQARVYALQALFQWHFTQESPEALLQDFILEHVTDTDKVDLGYFRLLFLEVVQKQLDIDKALTPYMRRSLSNLNPLELSALRLAAAELLYHPEVPRKVILNEAIELTKTFGASDGHKFVNAVLDALIKAQ